LEGKTTHAVEESQSEVIGKQVSLGAFPAGIGCCLFAIAYGIGSLTAHLRDRIEHYLGGVIMILFVLMGMVALVVSVRIMIWGQPKRFCLPNIGTIGVFNAT
jgi:hypothetical protein